MFKKTLLSVAIAVGLASGAMASGEGGEIHDEAFSFEGPFGRFDQHQLQRGLQVFTEVCAGCHGIKYVYFRNLSDEGGPSWTEDQMKAYTAQIEIYDPEIDDYRQAIPADNFPENDGANAPDLSLMAKARASFHGPIGLGVNQLIYGIGGPEYIAAFLTSFTGETKEQAGTILYENTVFPGGWTAMAPPPLGEFLEYADGHENTAHSEAVDVAAFLMWTAEPKMMARKKAAIVWVGLMILLTVLLYLSNKKLWAKVKRKD
ncbi:MAG: cytochrome c1 [Rhodobacteraceae bacterium]|nr:cytochrome c1 [Paracoccaceae bacterium]